MSKIILKNISKSFIYDPDKERKSKDLGIRFIPLEYLIDKLLSRKSQKLKVLDNVSLEINDGEILVIVGPTGCGKTTLLRIIAGLIEPDEGEVFFNNQSLKGVPPKDREMAMVFQSYALYPHYTSKGNIGFPLIFRRGLKENQRQEEIKKEDF